MGCRVDGEDMCTLHSFIKWLKSSDSILRAIGDNYEDLCERDDLIYLDFGSSLR